MGGSLHLQPDKLAGEKDEEGKWKVALDMEGARIAHDLVWQPGQQITGQVILEDTEVGQLKDNLPESNGHWPSVHPDQLLRLNAFTYRGFGANHAGTVDDRLRWVGSPGKAKRTGEPAGTKYFASQPYEQLAAVYRQAGQDTEASKVAIARRADLRKYGDLKPHRRIGNWLLDKDHQIRVPNVAGQSGPGRGVRGLLGARLLRAAASPDGAGRQLPRARAIGDPV